MQQYDVGQFGWAGLDIALKNLHTSAQQIEPPWSQNGVARHLKLALIIVGITAQMLVFYHRARPCLTK